MAARCQGANTGCPKRITRDGLCRQHWVQRFRFGPLVVAADERR